MTELAKRLWLEEQAEGLYEYALLLLLVSMTAVSTVSSLASKVRNCYAVVSMHVTQARQGGVLAGSSLDYEFQNSPDTTNFATGKTNLNNR